MFRKLRFEPLEDRRLLAVSPAGPEFRVHTTTAGTQEAPAIAADSDGDFVVVWHSFDSDTLHDVFGQRFSADGVPQGDEFQVNGLSADIQSNPDVAMDADGDFVVVWNSDEEVGGGYEVYARRFNSEGSPLGGEFLVNSTSLRDQDQPAVAMAPNGQFVVVWRSLVLDGSLVGVIFGQLYDAFGNTIGGEFRVDGPAFEFSRDPDVAMDDAGDFTVVWSSSTDAGSQIQGRRYVDGAALGGEFQVGVATDLFFDAPAVASDSTGRFVVAWSANTPADATGVVARRFDQFGDAVGSEFLVNTTVTDSQFAPSVAMAADGDFVVVWQSNQQDGFGLGVFARQFNALGNPNGPETQVNTETIGQQDFPAVAMDDDGDFIVAWEDTYQDPESGTGIYAQRFTEDLVCTEVQGEFQVNTTTDSHQHNGVVASDAVGNFVVIWTSAMQDHPTGGGIFARLFDRAGCARSEEILVNTVVVGHQTSPAVAMDADGDFVVAWESPNEDGFIEVHGQRFDSAGNMISGQFEVSGAIPNAEIRPSIGMAAGGNFVIVWESRRPGSTPVKTNIRIRGQRFNAAGTYLGEVFLVDEFEDERPVDEYHPDVAMSADGGFVVVWDPVGQPKARGYFADGRSKGDPFVLDMATFSPTVAMDPFGNSIVVVERRRESPREVLLVAQRFTAALIPFGDPIVVAEVDRDPFGVHLLHDVGIDAGGGFAVVWRDSVNVFARSFDEAGIPQGDARLVGSDPLDSSIPPSVAVSAQGPTVVVSTKRGQDGNGDGVFGQRLAPPGEFPVNSTTFSSQLFPVAAASDAGSVVIWQGFGDPSAAFDIYAQRYNAAGLATGAEFRINALAAGQQSAPAAAIDADGEFVVIWHSDVGDGDEQGIFGRRFANSGNPRGDEFPVNSTTAQRQVLPDIASDAEGNFVAVWQSEGQDGNLFGVYGQRFDRNGFALGGEFQVNTITLGNQHQPAVASDADGDFIVVWQSGTGDGELHGIYSQRYTRHGVPQGGEFLVNTVTAGDQTSPDVALDDAGNFVVVWHSFGQDGDAGGIFARLYDSTGLALGDAFAVNRTTAGDQTEPTVSRIIDGGFVIAWTSQGQDGDGKGVFATSFDAMGVPTSDEYRINATTAGNQSAASVAVDGDGDLFVAWQSDEQDGSGYGIFARRLAAASLPPPPPPPPPVLLTRSTAGFYDAANGAFFLRNANDTGVADLTFNYGAAGGGHVAAVGDWNGDDVDTVGLYAPDTGAFFLRNANSAGAADVTYVYGPGGLVLRPLVGDWNGDGIDTAGLYDPTNGAFFLRNVHAAGPADLTFKYGTLRAGTVPLAGDWDGDGIDTIGLYNPTTGAFFLKNSNAAGVADLTFDFGSGGANLTQLVGDWDADGDDTPGIYNKPNSVFFLRNKHSPGAADATFIFGPNASGWQPLIGDFNGPSTTGLRLAGRITTATDQPAVTEAAARPLLDEARARWAAASVDFNDARRAGGVSPLFPLPPLSPHPTLRIADLPGNLLGLAVGNEIVIDHNAAGRGWFIDPTPAADEEFQSINGRLLASDSIFAAEAVDLLTVIAHELGHLLGMDHAHDGLMAESLAPGTRKVPNR